MNVREILNCPCCGEEIIVNYSDTYGFSLDNSYLLQKLTEKANTAQQDDIMLKLCGTQRDRMDYLLNNLSQCCCYRGKYDE